MVRAGTVALMVVLLGVCVMNAPGMLGGATAAEDPVKFSKPTFVDPPKTLQGDSGDGRCPDPTQPCLKDVDDILFGRTHILRSDDVVFGYQGAYGLFPSANSTLQQGNVVSVH